MAEDGRSCSCQALQNLTPLSSIRDSAAGGCSYCSMVYNVINDTGARSNASDEASVQLENDHLEIRWQDDEAEYLRLYTTERAFNSRKAIVRRNHISVPGSQASFDLIQKWIEDCTTNHRFCKSNIVQDWSGRDQMPARILQIRQVQDQYQMNLLETPKEVGKYVALSHCWGLDRPLTTTIETINDRKAGIKWEKLPKTFQHAVIICAALGVEYLWIDSLCIVQDDEKDWGIESAKMSAVYANSWLTLAAASAPNSLHGMFPEPLPTKEYQISTGNSPGAKSITVFARKLRSPIDSRDHLLNESSNLPLFQRAWVLQERLLAQRILYFCDDEMAFECVTTIRCECSGQCEEIAQRHNGIDYIGLKYRFHSLLISWSHYHMLGSILPFSPTGILNVWDHLMHQFTQRHLTFGSDRLPALSGIARMMANTRALGQYNAGLWSGRLGECLLWFVDPTTRDCNVLPPAPTSTAPSWSWASINGAWNYRRTNSELQSLYEADRTLYVNGNGVEISYIGFACKDISLEIHPKGTHEYGIIKLGKIFMTAMVTSAEIRYEKTNVGESYATRFKNQKVLLVKKKDDAEMISTPFVDFVLDYGESPIPPGSTVECVSIQPETTSKNRCHGLVLLAVGNADEKVYRRIGKFLGAVGWFDGVELSKLTLV